VCPQAREAACEQQRASGAAADGARESWGEGEEWSQGWGQPDDKNN